MQIVINAVGTLPIYVCYLVILVWYFCHIVVDIVDLYRAVTAGYGLITEQVHTSLPVHSGS